MAKSFDPLSGKVLFDALMDEDCIIMAVNPRICNGVVKGIFRAAKELDAAVMFELAKSECDLNGGYTGLTPKDFSQRVNSAAREIGFDVWALHADHITVKKGSAEEIAETKKLIEAQISAGYTSFAIDASFLFDSGAKTVDGQLAKNVAVTTELAKFIEEKMAGKNFGLEVEVGEIGKEDADGRILTKPGEAVAFIKALNSNGVFPQAMAIANGSVHGNNYDAEGKLVEQVSIDIPQTIAVADALKKNRLDARIVQHGVTGTPRELIKSRFPHKAILKGNVATFWQNLVWDVLAELEPELFKEIRQWVNSAFREKAVKEGIKSEEELFGKYSKFVPGARDSSGKLIFFDRIYSVSEKTTQRIEDLSYKEALIFFDAFNAKGSAAIVRKYLRNRS